MWTKLEKTYPRIVELARQADTAAGDESYFKGLDEVIKRLPLATKHYFTLEQQLERLDSSAWCALKLKCLRYVGRQTETRGWDQLVSALNEAKGYCLLQQLGFLNIKFAEEQGSSTPDVVGALDGTVAHVEVKTIQKSDEAMSRRRKFGREALTFIAVPEGYGEPLAKKLTSKMAAANRQLGAVNRRIAFLVIEPDPPLTTERFQEIAAMLREVRPRDVEVVFEIRGIQSCVIPRIVT